MFDIDYRVLEFLLKKQKEGNNVLKYFKIRYPSKAVAQHNNNIFIGLAEANAEERTHQSQYYNNLVDVIITTKNKDYYQANKIFRAVSAEIIRLFRESNEFEDSFNVVSYIPKYEEGTLVIKQADLLLSFETLEDFNKNDDEIRKLEIDDVLIIEE